MKFNALTLLEMIEEDRQRREWQSLVRISLGSVSRTQEQKAPAHMLLLTREGFEDTVESLADLLLQKQKQKQGVR